MVGKTLNISDELRLPLDAVTATQVIYGGKGMGKTNLASVLAEELHCARLKFSAIDPMGVMWGLQHGARRGEPGLEVLILGGIHGDLPIEPSAGAVVADLVVDESVSTVIDISRRANGKSWTTAEKIRFVADYCTRLYERQGEKRVPIHQIIDEVGRFAPQHIPHGATDISRCLNAIEQMVEEGRNIGIGMTMVTLRSARLAKSVAELADCMIAFRTVGPNSVKAILDWFGEHVEKLRWKDLLGVLRTLPRGHALVVSPGWLEYEGVARMRPRMTFDSSATPKPGRSLRAPGKATKLDLAKYQARMAETIERAQMDDPAVLRERVKQLEQELSQARRAVPDTPKVAPKSNEVPVLQKGELNRLERSLQSLERVSGRLSHVIEQTNALGEAAKVVGNAASVVRDAILYDQNGMRGRHVPAPVVLGPLPSVPATLSGKFPPRFDTKQVGEPGLDGPKQRILDALAWCESIGFHEPEQVAVAFLAMYTVGGGAFNNPRGALRTAGLIEYRGSKLALTDVGRRLAHVPDAPLTSDELLRRVYECLPTPEQKLLRAAVEVYPRDIADEDLAVRTGYTAGGGAFNNPKGRLRTLGLISYPARKRVRAADLLFLHGTAREHRVSVQV